MSTSPTWSPLANSQPVPGTDLPELSSGSLATTAPPFIVSDKIGDFMPWLLLVAAIGSQTSAIICPTSSRSDMVVNATVPASSVFS